MNAHLPVLRLLCCALFVTLAATAPHAADPPKAPLSLAESLKTFHLDAGLRMELVASEPQIESPVAMAFDEDGRLWVVEMRDYPNGPAKGQPPEGRIKILDDKDGDGRFETSRVFADQLLFANGVLPWKGGVFVTAAPHILYMKDTDGDGKADLREVLFEGFAEGNPQLRVSYPLLGIDGWVYCCNGLRGGSIVRSGKSQIKPLNLSGKDFRFDPNNPDRFEAISGMGQFGHTFDDWGNRFVCDNNHHLRHVVLEDRYLKRNPYLAVPSVLEDVSELEPGPLSSGGRIYPLTRNWTTSSLHAGRFTAACGVHIYRGSLLGEPYRGAAFTCEPTGNLVHMEILRPHGATFRSRPHKQGAEFLASTDEWFRPVFLTSGSDGALYVVDMYRAVIEHPEFVPEELKKRPDLLLGKERGRIWRIVKEGITTETRTTQRKPQESMPDSVWTLESVLKLSDGAEARTRFQAALRLGEWHDDQTLSALARIALRDADDHWVRWAVQSSVANRAGGLIEELFKQGLAERATPARLTLLQELAGLAGARQDFDECSKVLEVLQQHDQRLPPGGRIVALLGLAEGMARRGKSLATFLETLPSQRQQRKQHAEVLFAFARDVACQRVKAEGEFARIDAVRLLAHAPWFVAGQALPPLLADGNQVLRLVAVRALAAHSHQDVPALLMKGWKSASPPVRRELLEAMLRQPDRVAFLLAEVEAGRVKPGDIDAARRQQLVKHSNQEIREKAVKLLQASVPEERKQVLARYQAALKLKGDPKQGREVFQKHCATCHRVAGIGVDVGSDIADTRTKSPEQLLHDILNPNAAIDANYINYLVQTKSGRVASGVIAAETATSVTLKRAENQLETILRQDIEETQSTGLSLMPEGLEQGINVEQMASLIDFLKNWRYLDGLTPLSSPLSPMGGEGSGVRGANAVDRTPVLPSRRAEGLKVVEHDDHIVIETDVLQARINKKGYVSGIAQPSFVDKKTGAKDAGFGLHIMDFLLAPSWRDDGYTRDAKLHGNLPKHYEFPTNRI
jgi:putative membrane-bound dehydrogenase-like protein